MSPEIRVVLYILFAASLFFVHKPVIFLVIFAVLCLFLSGIPFRKWKGGFLPIGLFLLFTFMSNVLNQHGRILLSWGSFIITEEGITLATFKALRFLFMVAGAKILMSTTPMEQMIKALGTFLNPCERLGLPVKDFLHTLGLTVQCFPALKKIASETYARNMRDYHAVSFFGKAKIVAAFLLPLFVKSIQSPELFFQQDAD